MKSAFHYQDQRFEFDLNQPAADLSLPVAHVARAWYIPPPSFSPVVLGNWTGSVEAGSSVNFFNVSFNPHAHSTHTETAGHILPERYSIDEHFRSPFSWALLLRIAPVDGMVKFEQFLSSWNKLQAKAPCKNLSEISSVIISSEVDPENTPLKEYSNTDWPYLDPTIGTFLREHNIDHLLVDQPSVDREEDGGQLACHHSFWGPHPERTLHRTISELLCVPKKNNAGLPLKTGVYLLNLQVAPIHNDAAPSRPLLYGPIS